jgi:CBS domain-containing protein
VDTAAISYRVAEFLKKYPPFHVMEEEDLLQLAQRGRVKFFEPNEYVLAQGGSRLQVFVIQQGTVSLWDERGSEAKLLDVRGAGDMLGIDQLNEVRSHPYAARSASDVLIYAFSADEFESLVLKYAYAKQYVSAYGSLSSSGRLSQERRGPQNMSLRELITGKELTAVDNQVSVQEAARYMLTTQDKVIAVLDSDQRTRAILTAESLLQWIVNGGDVQESVAQLLNGRPPVAAADASVTDGVIELATADGDALAITSDGTITGRLQAIVTAQSLGQVFGDRPTEILREIRGTVDPRTLRQLNERARAFVLRYVTSSASSEWLSDFTSSVDASIVRQIIAKAVPDELSACWCFCGSAGRGESLTKLRPQILMIADDATDDSQCLDAYERVLEVLDSCDYLPQVDCPFEPSFYAATLTEWRKRYNDWVSDPILNQIYRARPLFDLSPIHGPQSLWHEVDATVMTAVNREFLQVLANDCLASLPPLTFFENAVIDESGEETNVFRLEHSALGPLVDVGRVFGMAARRVFGSSTLERFEIARRLMPERASIFLEAAETFRIVLWQQGRVGISQGTGGMELPPSSLGRYDRQLLRSGFRSILRLLEFTADLEWLKTCD